MESNTETLAAAVAMTRGEPKPAEGYCILSIDAWREPDGGWQWNAWYDTGERFPRILIDAKPRAILRWMRDNGLLSAASAGRMALDDDGYNIVAVAKGTHEPIFAIEYGSEG